ncbi:MAG: flagellar biosynthetic protein FliR [Acidimicrobiales bacterium]
MTINVNELWLIAFFLVLARGLAWMMVVTPFSGRGVIPTVVTVGVAAGLAILVAPRLEHSAVPQTFSGVIGALALQVMTGLALGFVVQLMLSAVTAAGTFLDMTGGLSLPPSMNPLSGTESALMGTFYSQVVVLLLFTSGGYLLMIDGFIRSFSGPGFTLATSQSVVAVITTDLGAFFASALEVAAPILLVLFAAQVVLGLLSKAAPQANVWMLGFPLQIFIVLVMVGLTATGLPNEVANLLSRGVGDGAHMFGVV